MRTTHRIVCDDACKALRSLLSRFINAAVVDPPCRAVVKAQRASHGTAYDIEAAFYLAKGFTQEQGPEENGAPGKG